MMHDSPPRIDPVLSLARNQMQLVENIHRTYLAIVSGKDETQVVEFDHLCFADMMDRGIPELIREIRALGVIISSPVPDAERYGAVVTLIDRTVEAFYVPIVRIINADQLIGDFRPTDVVDPERYARIHTELSLNWIRRGEE